MKKNIFRNNWVSIYIGFEKAGFRFSKSSYDDDRMHFSFNPSIFIPLIGIFFTGLSLWSLIWMLFIFFGYGHVYLDLPIHSGIFDSEPPEYGFYFYGGDEIMFNSFWLCLGKKNKCFYMPWDWDWVKTKALRKDGTWEVDDKKKQRKHFYEDKWKEVLWSEEYPYKYKLRNGFIQERTATVKVTIMEWRWRAFKWLPFPRKIHKDIDVKFSYGGPIEREILFEKEGHKIKKTYTGEVGERTGEWKGGTTGCGYRMEKGETPEQTLRRMEKERIFN